MYLFETIDGDDIALGAYLYDHKVVVEMSDKDNFVEITLSNTETRALRDALSKVLDD